MLSDARILQIEGMRRRGWTWNDVAQSIGPVRGEQVSGDALRKRYGRAVEGRSVAPPDAPEPIVIPGTAPAQQHETLDDLICRLDVDMGLWDAELVNVRRSEWDMANGEKGESLKVSANFKRKPFTTDGVRDIWDAFIADIANHGYSYSPLPRSHEIVGATGLLGVVSVADPHFGMLAHHEEVGSNYDLKIAETRYVKVSKYLVDQAIRHQPEKLCIIVGNDLFHANQMDGKTATTRRGTPQDADGRFHEVFTAVRRAVIEVVDYAVQLSDVDVVMVPGNHDHDEVYRLGEVLEAWYRKDGFVNVFNTANKRVFYGWGSNAFMLTHGEEYLRKRDNLAMILLSEMPTELLTSSAGGLREVLCGHNHASMVGGYYPTGELSETRGVRTRSLPGLTSADAWHHEEGYKHHQAGTLLLYDWDGGLHCYYERRP